MQKTKSATLMTRGFTLIELLVVVSIIALMVAIMMPSLKEVRRISRRTICQKSLDQIGLGMHNYLAGHKDTYPYACRVPSWERTEAAKENPPRKPLPSIPEVLRNEVKGGKLVQSKSTDSYGYVKTTTMSVNEVFACPADQNTMSRKGDPAVAPNEVVPTARYFDNEGTSYEWEDRLNGEVVGFKLMRLYAKDKTRRVELAKLSKSQMWMMFDFESFHGGKTIRGSQNILYADLHVQADNWTDGKSVGKEMGMIP
jgi:prepilin-type N-terminal cleavage/methylation domain-containing protein